MGLTERLSSTLLKVLPSDQFLKVRNFYHKLRSTLAPLLRAVYGHFSTDELISELDSKLDSDWDVLMVHSSLNNLAPAYDGNTMELLHALIKYCGPDRTLVMPAFNFGEYGEGPREMLKREPRFDLRRAPSQMGLLTELFRRSPGVIQSRHPAYRVAALGPLAQELTAGHENLPSGMGVGSPFDYMAQKNAQIVGIGKPFQVMTQVHHIESLLGDKWPVPVKTQPNIPITLVDKKTEFIMQFGGVTQLWTFNIWKLREIMPKDELKEWRFHNCPMFAARAGTVTNTLLEAAETGFTLYDA